MLEDIITFCAIVKNNGLAKAARQLGISTPIVTRRLARLEKSLDCRLINRTTRQFNLTEAGNLFYSEVNEILQKLETSKKNIKNLTQTIAGTLKIGIPVSISHLYLTEKIHTFISQYPDLKIQIVNGNHLLDLLDNGFDLILYCSRLPDSNFYFQKIGNWKKIICAAPQYLKKYGTPKNPEDLTAHNCLDHYQNLNHTWKFQQKNQLKELMVHGNLRVDSSIDLKNLAVSGAGIAYLPSFTVHRELQTGSLVSILEHYQPPPIGMYAVYPSKTSLSKKTQTFLDFLIELLTPILY